MAHGGGQPSDRPKRTRPPNADTARPDRSRQHTSPAAARPTVSRQDGSSSAIESGAEAKPRRIRRPPKPTVETEDEEAEDIRTVQAVVEDEKQYVTRRDKAEMGRDVAERRRKEAKKLNADRERQRSGRRDAEIGGRKERESTWRKLWTINGFITPWLSSWILWIFRWRFFKFLGRKSPWMLILLDLLMVALVGLTGSGIVPDSGVWEGGGWYAYREGYRLGLWGYCDDSGKCVYWKPFYDIRWAQDPALLYSTRVLSGILAFVALGGLLLLLSTTLWIIPLKLITSRHSYALLTCTGCTNCIESAIQNSMDKSDEQAARQKREDGKLRDGKEAWMVALEWVLWAFMLWVVVGFTMLEVWQRVAGAEKMTGDDVMRILLGLALAWMVVWFVYRSDWACLREKVYEVDNDNPPPGGMY